MGDLLVVGQLLFLLQSLLGLLHALFERLLRRGAGRSDRRRLGVRDALGSPVLLNRLIRLRLPLLGHLLGRVARCEVRLALGGGDGAGGDDLRAVGPGDRRGHADCAGPVGGRLSLFRGTRLRRRTPRGIAFRTAVGVRGGDGNGHHKRDGDGCARKYMAFTHETTCFPPCTGCTSLVVASCCMRLMQFSKAKPWAIACDSP